DPSSHLFLVTLDVSAPSSPSFRVAMPAWAPGSYLVRDFARNVQDFSAVDARGRALAWRRVDKSTWEVETPPRAGRVRVRYAVWASELSVRTSHLDASHGFVAGADVFMHVVGAKELPASLVVRPFRGWRVDTALEARGG